MIYSHKSHQYKVMSSRFHQPAQDRLKRLQSSLKKVDKPKHVSNRNSHKRQKVSESASVILSAFTNDGPSTSTSPNAATNASSTTNTNSKAKDPSQTKSTSSIISRVWNYCSELTSTTKKPIVTNTVLPAPTSPTDSTHVMRLPSQQQIEKNPKSRSTNVRKRLRNTWEKPKALIDSMNNLNNKRPKTGISSKRNQANERLNRLRATLKRNLSNNRVIDAAIPSLNMVHTAKPTTPTPAHLHCAPEMSSQECISLMRLLSDLDYEPMDWQPTNEQGRNLVRPKPPEQSAAQVPDTDDCDNDNDDEDTSNDLYDFTSDSSEDQYDNSEDAISESGGGGDTQSVKLSHNKETNVSFELRTRDGPASSSNANNEQELMHTIMKDIVSQLNSNDETNLTLPNWKLDNLYFVLDTNVLLNYLIFVEELTQLSLCDTAGSMLYIPFMVIRELDNLKERNCNEGIRLKAIRAIRYLNTKFDESHDIQAQSAQAEKEHLIDVESPDDSILNCCLQLKKKVPHMMLLTDDGNLRLKAKASGIAVTTKSDLISEYPEKFVALNAP